MKKIVLTGGGTGGHIIPNIALIPELKKHFEIYYFGQKNGLEYDLISKFDFVKFVEIEAVKLIRKITLKNLAIPFKLAKSIKLCKKYLQEINPDIIFAKGGYVSLPVVFAGSNLKIPILAHESDVSMGLANKLILKKCKLMLTSFRETCVGNKCMYSGSPVREEIFKANPEKAKIVCGFKKDQPTLLFFGGSLGSKAINHFVVSNINSFSNFNIIHIVGKGNLTSLKRDNYFQVEFLTNIFDFFALADIVVCRAGSNSIFELLAMRKNMILIPLGKEVSRGDQIENANIFKREGFASVIMEKDLNIENFLNIVNNLFKNKKIIKDKMEKYNKKGANALIIEQILKNSK